MSGSHALARSQSSAQSATAQGGTESPELKLKRDKMETEIKDIVAPDGQIAILATKIKGLEEKRKILKK